MEFQKDRDTKIESAKCKLVVDSEAEILEVKRAVDAMVQSEDKKVEEAMNARMDNVRDQRRKQLNERKKELLKHQTAGTGLQIVLFKQ